MNTMRTELHPKAFEQTYLFGSIALKAVGFHIPDNLVTEQL